MGRGFGHSSWGARKASGPPLVEKQRRHAMKYRIVKKNAQAYQEIVKYAALHTEGGMRHIFAGRKFFDMDSRTSKKLAYRSFYDEEAPRGDVEVNFKWAEIELSIMYDNLYTKSRVIQTMPGTILRCVSLVSTVVAFVLYVKIMSSSADAEQTAAAYNDEYRRSIVDATVTYILFIGAFCLEACSLFIMMVSPWEWPFLEARSGWRHLLLSRVAWPIFVRIQPETKAWWSNSMGQYNLFGSSRSMSVQDHKKWSSIIVKAHKMAGVFGVSDLWNKISSVKHAQVKREVKELINESIGREPVRVPSAYRLLLTLPFEQALVTLHLWTDVVLHKVAKSTMMISSSGRPQVDVATQEKEAEWRRLMDNCKMVSEYVLYLMVVHPSMLPVSTNVQDVLALHSDLVRGASNKDDIPDCYSGSPDLIVDYPSDGSMSSLDWMVKQMESAVENSVRPDKVFWSEQRAVLEKQGSIDAELEILEQVWVRMLVYAAGKCRPEEHARRLSTGGELITFVWLLMVYKRLGDVGFNNVSLIKDDFSLVYLFDLEDSVKKEDELCPANLT
ncbi:hypothetical protein CFC21_106206 [Triticum aestivum]|uniref:DUF4220 domain-containing protein n=2 Tax=Triticum aestivum TaxID=4565 RepID=A0A3B6SUN6_WHEAT|nr:hypothetical protein CFC21_106206 [Triticum aestivum]